MNYYFLSLLTMGLLGIHYFLTKLITPYVSGQIVAMLACLLSVPVIFLYININKQISFPQNGIYIFYSFLISIPLAIGLITLYMALEKGPVSVVMPIYGMNALVTILLSVIFLHEKLTPSRTIGIIFSLIAIILLSR